MPRQPREDDDEEERAPRRRSRDTTDWTPWILLLAAMAWIVVNPGGSADGVRAMIGIPSISESYSSHVVADNKTTTKAQGQGAVANPRETPPSTNNMNGSPGSSQNTINNNISLPPAPSAQEIAAAYKELAAKAAPPPAAPTPLPHLVQCNFADGNTGKVCTVDASVKYTRNGGSFTFFLPVGKYVIEREHGCNDSKPPKRETFEVKKVNDGKVVICLTNRPGSFTIDR